MASLLRHTGDASALDKPEQLLLSLVGIPRLEGRILALMFKAQLEPDMDDLSKQARAPMDLYVEPI